jgi:SpoVK/Ycf46/Vps4 family AAA+-type ATPase
MTFLRALRAVESVSPAVLWIDEIEMGVGGYREGQDASMSRIFSGFLTWMQEKSAMVFVAATANRIHLLPAEIIRKGRFDQVFFVGVPNEEESEAIFTIQLKKSKCDVGASTCLPAKATNGWNGAEIEQAVIPAVVDAYAESRRLRGRHVQDDLGHGPAGGDDEEQIKQIRSWAHERAERE